MSFFGDSLAHASLLGAGLGLLAGVSPFGALTCFCLAAALLLAYASEKHVPFDALLAVLAHGGLAFGVLLTHLASIEGPGHMEEGDHEDGHEDGHGNGHEGGHADEGLSNIHGLEEFLFGSLERIGLGDLFWLCVTAALALAGLVWIWRSLLMATLAPDLAQAENVPVVRVRAIFLALLALVVAVEIRVTGVLLVSALLIIPAAAARGFVSTPGQMFWGALGIGFVSVLGGMGVYGLLGTPPGPSIACVAVVCFLASRLAFVGRGGALSG